MPNAECLMPLIAVPPPSSLLPPPSLFRLPPQSSKLRLPFNLTAFNMAHTDAVVVMTTVATADEAVALVQALLERRLIACGTLLPGARSIYRWEGKTADEQETVILLKTRSARLESLEVAFGELHPYKVPELLALPVTAGLGKYLDWITGETSLALT
jgi:periplasmic divalent cation tolerance protein